MVRQSSKLTVLDEYALSFSGPGDDALLGATTLEVFKLLVDPNTGTLWPASHSPLGGGGRPVPLIS